MAELGKMGASRKNMLPRCFEQVLSSILESLERSEIELQALVTLVPPNLTSTERLTSTVC